MYGVCVTFPKVFPAVAVGGSGSGPNGPINESNEVVDYDDADDADDNDKPNDAATVTMLAPVADTPAAVPKPKSGQKGGSGKDRAVRGQSPPPQSCRRGGRRSRGGGRPKDGGGGDRPDMQVVLSVTFIVMFIACGHSKDSCSENHSKIDRRGPVRGVGPLCNGTLLCRPFELPKHGHVDVVL